MQIFEALETHHGTSQPMRREAVMMIFLLEFVYSRNVEFTVYSLFNGWKQ